MSEPEGLRVEPVYNVYYLAGAGQELVRCVQQDEDGGAHVVCFRDFGRLSDAGLTSVKQAIRFAARQER